MAQLTTSWQKVASAYLGQTLYVHLYMRYTKQDVENNRSYVEYYCGAQHDSYIYDQQGAAAVGGTGASEKTASIQTIRGYVDIVGTGGWVNHASDGSGSVYGRADLSMPNWRWWNRAEAYATLPTIPRASTISTNVSKMGTAGNIYISRASSSFTHTITYSFGNASGTIATKTSSTTVSWTPATTLAAQVPNGTYGTCTLTCDTYSGNTLIGTKTTSFTLYISDSTVPSLTSITAAQSGDATAIGWGVYVQGKSKATVTFNGAAAGYGSTIQSYKVVCDSYNDTTSPFETDYLTSGTRTIYGYVYDKRGRSVYKTTTVTVQPYAVPYLTAIDAYRCTSGNTKSDEGTYLRFKATANFSPCKDGNNTAKNSVTLAYKLLNSSGGTVASGTFTSNTYKRIGGSLAINQTYTLQLTITDALGESQTYSQHIETAAVAMNIKPGGTAVAFGKYATEDKTFDIALGWKLGKTFLNALIPVGFVIATSDSANPSSYLGGTWVAIQNKVIIGKSTTYSADGGSTTNTHNHGLSAGYTYLSITGGKMVLRYKSTSAWGSQYQGSLTAEGSWGVTVGDAVTLGGTTDNNTKNNNMMPYTPRFLWEKTAS